MKRLTTLFILILCLVQSLSFSQTNDSTTLTYVGVYSYEIDYSSIQKIISPKILDYEGSYHFGESEGESQLEIIHSNGKLFARTEYYDWEQDSWVLKSKREPINFIKGKIEIDGINYELHKCIKSTYLTLDKGDLGLVSQYYDNADEKNIHYIQFNTKSPINKPVGKYPETSFIKLNTIDLFGFSKYELKIMRNEIFARNGYIFKQDGEMDKYFSKKEWYKKGKWTTSIEIDEQVLKKIEEIEKHNIDLIIESEK